MIGDLFDSPWKILIVALVIIVLFGSKKLPSAARSLGQAMRILKKEVQGLHEDEPEPGPPGAQAAAQAPAEITVGAPGSQPAQQRSPAAACAPDRGERHASHTGRTPAVRPGRDVSREVSAARPCAVAGARLPAIGYQSPG
jgi:sec-independent protein translocase protein TatA